MIDDDDGWGVRGGQGRSAGEIADLCWCWGLFACVVVICVLCLSGCIKAAGG